MSGPLSGASSASARAAMMGAQMALLAHGARIGRYRVVLKMLDDATPQSDGWDPGQTIINAHVAAQDPATAGYIGDFDSGASAIAIPVLNRAGVAEVSPEGGAVGLTSPAPGASPGEPGKYYPTGRRTFARVVPSDAVEAAAIVSLQRSLGCRAPFVLQDGEVDGEDAAISYVLAAQAAGLRVPPVQSYQRRATDYSALGRAVAQSGADCVLLDGSDERSAARVVRQVAGLDPHVRVIASSPLADSAFADPARGGVPAALEPRVVVVSPALATSSYPAAARQFLARYDRLYGPPALQAIFGYEAMNVMLEAISAASDDGRRTLERGEVAAHVLGTRHAHTVLGSYSIDRQGDSSIDRLAVYRLSGGHLVYWLQENG